MEKIMMHTRLLMLACLGLLALGLMAAFNRGPDPKDRILYGSEASEARFVVQEITETQAQRLGLDPDQPMRANQPAQEGRVHYFADGYAVSDPLNKHRQANWVCMFNPHPQTAKLTFTFYYEDSAPTQMEYDVPAETARSINLYECKEVRHNQRFGTKIESSVPLVIQVSTGYFGPGDKKDWYTRAMHSVICNTAISTINYYADGFVIDKEEMRLKEPEWAFLLNPNPERARVLFYAYYSHGEKKIYALEIPPQRLFPLHMDPLVIKNKLFGAKFVSSVPLCIQQTRLVEEKGKQIIRAAHSVMARPGDHAASDAP